MQEHQSKVKQWSAQCDHCLAESVEVLASLEDSGEKTVHAQTQKIARKPTSVAGIPNSEEMESASFSLPHSSSKQALLYSEPPEKINYLMNSRPLTSKDLVWFSSWQ